MSRRNKNINTRLVELEEAKKLTFACSECRATVKGLARDSTVALFLNEHVAKHGKSVFLHNSLQMQLDEIAAAHGTDANTLLKRFADPNDDLQDIDPSISWDDVALFECILNHGGTP